MKSRGIYIHIPFCKKRCDYCDFTSFKYDEVEVDKYIELLINEIKLYSGELLKSNITSIYIGGGTPSVLNCKQIDRLFGELKAYYDKGIEITFEVNPESIDKEKLSCLKEAGVNRISIGVQSLDDTELKFLGRIHSSSVAIEAIKAVSEMGFNFSTDFIYGFDKNRDITLELDEIIKYKPNHISLYPLEVYQGSKISTKIDEIDDEYALCEYKVISKYLRDKGYEHYEVSNFAIKGFESKHNSSYWRGMEYFGFGVSSHGYLNSVRYENSSIKNEYEYMIGNNKKPIINENLISTEEKKLEYIMLGLRLSSGISLIEYEKKFGEKFNKLSDKAVLKYIDSGLLLLDNGYLKLSEEGNYQMNNILVALL